MGNHLRAPKIPAAARTSAGRRARRGRHRPRSFERTHRCDRNTHGSAGADRGCRPVHRRLVPASATTFMMIESAGAAYLVYSGFSSAPSSPPRPRRCGSRRSNENELRSDTRLHDWLHKFRGTGLHSTVLPQFVETRSAAPGFEMLVLAAGLVMIGLIGLVCDSAWRWSHRSFARGPSFSARQAQLSVAVGLMTIGLGDTLAFPGNKA